MNSKFWLAAVSVVALTACAVDTDTGPSGDDPVDGVVYSAEVQEIINLATRQFVVNIKMRNVTDAAVTRRYPVACAVQIRLYRPQTNQRVYDEALTPCTPPDSLTATIQPGQTITLSSGIRQPQSFTDSLPAVEYRVSAIVHTERNGVLEVFDGLYKMPNCVVVGTGTTCS
jgi:hypothetical protein